MQKPKTLLGASIGIWLLAMAGASVLLISLLIISPQTGLSLGYFYAGLVLANLIAITCATASRSLREDWVILLFIGITTSVIWILAGIQFSITDTLLASIALLTIMASVLGILRFLQTLGIHETIALTITTLLFIGWLSLPIWCGTCLLSAPSWILDVITKTHPLIALNGQLHDLGYWSHQSIAYKYLLNLGQDIAYTPPASILWCAVLHALVAGVTWVVAWKR